MFCIILPSVYMFYAASSYLYMCDLKGKSVKIQDLNSS